MRTALGIGKGILKVLFLGIVAVGAFIMKCISAIIFAIRNASASCSEKLRDSQQRGKGAGNKAVLHSSFERFAR